MRVYVNEVGDLLLNEGEYGQDSKGVWYARPPGQHTGCLSEHEVEENEDGTITVRPSILIDDSQSKPWHGYLTKGEWKETGKGGEN